MEFFSYPWFRSAVLLSVTAFVEDNGSGSHGISLSLIHICAVLNVVLFLTGGLIMQVRISLLGLVIGTAVSVLIALLVEFFVFSVDYSRTEYAQFEDDEYY